MKEKMKLKYYPAVVILVLSLVLPPVKTKISKHVSVKLNAKWASTPLMLEASEFLAKEGEDHFWNFVDELVEIDNSSYGDHHEEAMYHLSLKLAEKILTPLQVNLLKFSMALRVHSPTVEMFNHISHDKQPPTDCGVFVEINNMITCEKSAMLGFMELAEQQPPSTVIKSDHHYPGSKGKPIVVVFYAQLGQPAFTDWHKTLKQLATDGKIDYVLRHYVQNPSSVKVRLSGYGVELAIKSTEYKATDDTKVEDESQVDEEKEDEVEGFVFSKLKSLHPTLRDNLKDFRQHLIDSQADLAPMKVWQLQDLSFQAAEKIMNSEDKLKTLRDVSQNFPTQAKSLAKIPVTKDLKDEIKKNQKVLENNFGVSPGDSAIFINGLQADLDIYDVFTLLDTMKSEAKLMEGLHALGKQYNLASEDVSQMQQIDLKDEDSNYAVDCRDESVVWVNNLEVDRKYQTWPSSVQELLRPTFPGMLRHVRRNLFNAVFFVNPADNRYIELMKMVEAFYVHNAPMRIGLVFVVNSDPDVDGLEDAGVAILRAFNYIRKNEHVTKALSFVTDLYEAVQDGELTVEFVLQEFINAYDGEPAEVFGQNSEYDKWRMVYDRIKNDEITSDVVLDVFKSLYPKENYNNVFGSDSNYDEHRQEASEFFERTGLGEVPQVVMNGVPMKKEEIEPDEFEEAIVSSILKQTPELQKEIYHGSIFDGQDIFEHMMTRSNVMPRLNSRVLNPGEDYLDLSKEMPEGVLGNPSAFKNLVPAGMSSALASNLKYLAKKEEEILRPVTNWVVTDVSSKEGRALLYEGMKQLKHTNSMRLAVVHNPTGDTSDRKNLFIAQAIQVAIETLSTTMAKSFVTKLLKEENIDDLNSGTKSLEEFAVNNMDYAAYDEALTAFNMNIFESHSSFCKKVLDMQPGQMAIISNGRIIGPLKDGELFIQQDFTLLDKYMSSTSADKIEKKLKPLNLDPVAASDLVMKISTLLASVPQKDTRKEVPLKHINHSVITIPPKEDGPAYDVVALLDPGSRAAQKYTPLIMVLQQVANVNIKVFLNCRDKLSEMPLKSFYRYVLEPEVRFSVDSSVATGPTAQFDDMPEQPILTLGMDPPESWLVEAIWSPYDLDNIHLAEIQKNVNSEFELEHLLLEGHCYDSNTGQPPRGLQFILGTENNPAQVDTIVMANLGYFQLKASPGAWYLKLRPGRSQDIYNIVSHDYTDSPEDSSDVIVVIDNFKSKIIKLRVNKKAGMEREDLLSEKEEEPQGLWDSISSKLTGGGTDMEAAAEGDQTINIFTLASGHLYERLLRIMIASVMKHTKSNVKFWFLKNYLSPSFKDFIPHMSEEYGFEYELVQYKWPRWLHQQTEKQRIIWGYKILFLDVLFPLNVNKIIFVDADQIVRTDLQELVDFDLEGAPYGYTPFCDSRREMDGFRFWSSGYWASHLAGRRYHISALYVVDLTKFRKIAAGDRLRGQYQGLSQDPNSLSNLDQDLPNNMIHQVPIKSLPQEWLWCETWCSDEEKSKAKTIDMCNNPRTKEPKLQAAQRIAPEWTTYDQDIKKLWDRVYKNKETSSKIETDSKDSQSQDTKGKDSHTEL